MGGQEPPCDMPDFSESALKPWEVKLNAEMLVGQTVLVNCLTTGDDWRPAVIARVDSEINPVAKTWAFEYLCHIGTDLITIPLSEAADRLRRHPACQEELQEVAIQNLGLMGNYTNPISTKLPTTHTYTKWFDKEIETSYAKRHRQDGHCGPSADKILLAHDFSEDEARAVQ